MIAIPGQPQQTGLAVRAVAAALANASAGEVVLLDLGGINETDPARRKAAVAGRLRDTTAELEAMIRSRTAPPARPSRALLGARLAGNGEVSGPDTYTPGPGFEALLKSLLIDTEAAADAAAAKGAVR